MDPSNDSQSTKEQLTKLPSKKSKKKFFIIGGVLIGILVIALGAFFLLKDSDDKQVPAKSSATESVQKNVQVGEYLEIPEIGVRLKLPAEIKDAYYIIDKRFADNDRNWAFISTKTLKELDQGCSAEDEARLAPGYVSYFTDPNEPWGAGEDSTVSSYYPDNFKLGDKYVFYSTYQQSPCYQPEDPDTAKTDRINTIYELFGKARLEGIDSPKSDLATPTNQDVIEIITKVESLCKEAGGYGGIGITKEYLTTEKEGARPYYNGYAIVNIGCKDEGGGYQSYMQRQADGSYKDLFGGQDVPDCTKVDQYKIPKQILPLCLIPDNSQPANFRDNTN